MTCYLADKHSPFHTQSLPGNAYRSKKTIIHADSGLENTIQTHQAASAFDEQIAQQAPSGHTPLESNSLFRFYNDADRFPLPEHPRMCGEKLFVDNLYTGTPLQINSAAIQHGITGSPERQLRNAAAGAVIGHLAANAIPVNELIHQKTESQPWVSKEYLYCLLLKTTPPIIP